MVIKILFSFLAGVTTWSFAEYYLHNFVGHLGKGRNVFSREHLAHHVNPSYFTPTRKKLMAATAAMVIIFLLTFPLLGLISAIYYTLGFITFYATYEVIHRRIHTHPPKGKYSRWARKHHMHHHFAPKKNHGVTTPVWDYVFRTHTKTGIVKVLPKNVMKWLCDDNGSVKPEYASDYEVVAVKKQVQTSVR